jgi:hypothetical protein
MRDPKVQAEVDAALAAARVGDVPAVPEHAPEPEGATLPGLTYCMRCGRLLRSAKRGEASGATKACKSVRVTFRNESGDRLRR